MALSFLTKFFPRVYHVYSSMIPWYYHIILLMICLYRWLRIDYTNTCIYSVSDNPILEVLCFYRSMLEPVLSTFTNITTQQFKLGSLHLVFNSARFVNMESIERTSYILSLFMILSLLDWNRKNFLIYLNLYKFLRFQ